MIPVQIDKDGNVSYDTDEGLKAWGEVYDEMIAKGATEDVARKAADEIKEKMDRVCSDGPVDDA
jgi:hypothetical protein